MSETNTTSQRIALVGCGSAKVELEEGETIAAKDLYTSNYFQLKREYAEECCDEWYILSAKHGLLDPDEQIETYDASLSTRSDAYIGYAEADNWAVTTSDAIKWDASNRDDDIEYVVLAGEDYAEHIEVTLESIEADASFPFRSDDIGGFGDQMGWLRDTIDATVA